MVPRKQFADQWGVRLFSWFSTDMAPTVDEYRDHGVTQMSGGRHVPVEIRRFAVGNTPFVLVRHVRWNQRNSNHGPNLY